MNPPNAVFLAVFRKKAALHNIFIKKEIFTMEQIYKGYSAFDAMTQTDFFFHTDAKKEKCRHVKSCGGVYR